MSKDMFGNDLTAADSFGTPRKEPPTLFLRVVEVLREARDCWLDCNCGGPCTGTCTKAKADTVLDQVDRA